MLSLPAISRERRNCVARLRVKAGSAASPLIEGLPQLLSTSAPLKCALPPAVSLPPLVAVAG